MTVPGTSGEQLETELIDFLAQRTKAEWTADRDLFAEGGLSSLFAMELVVHLETRYGITIGGPDLRLANFRTIRAMTGLVHRLREAA
jgi:methoxymalonate biosynthesis acyl carrier protein